MRPPKGFTTGLPRRWRFYVIAAAVAFAAIIGALGTLESGIPARLNNAFLDVFARMTATASKPANVVVIDVDDVSLAAVGQWPWPRYRIASLLEAVAAQKPAAIGLDILFAEPDRTSLKNIRQSYKQDFGIDISFNGPVKGLSDNDGYLGEVLAGTGAVGAKYFYFDHATREAPARRVAFRFDGRTDLLALNEATGVLDNTPEIAQQLRYSGFLNTKADADGVLRRVPLLIRYGELVQPQLALATFMRSVGADHAVIAQDAHGLSIRVGGRSIPINRQGLAVLQLKGPSTTYAAIPALEVLNGNVSPATLAGKVVFIGSSAAGLNDLHSTLFDAQFPGLKVQAAIADDIDSAAFIREPSWAGAAIMAACLLVGLLMALIFTRLREPLHICLATAALALTIIALAGVLFATSSIYLSPAFPVVLAMLLFLGLTTTRFALEKRRAYAWFRKLANAQQVAMESMAAVAETRDPETGAHIKRTQHYVKAIAEKLRQEGHYLETLTTDFIALLFASAPLHDIGKVGVPDHILLKPGKLTADEFELMKKHAEYGRDIIHSAADKIEGENFLNIAGEIAYGHHEKWDGSGYPQALRGQAIPLSARIMTVADVYDALISRRCYKEPFPHAQAFDMMREERGRIFDPTILDCFFSIETAIRDIANTYRDEHEMVLGDR